MYLLDQLGDFLYVLIFILAVLLYCILIRHKKYDNNGRPITYYIKPSNTDIRFKWDTKSILNNSTINSTHSIEETLNPVNADIYIELTPRDQLNKMFYDKDNIEYYQDTNERIWYSFTTQNPKPRIYIDEINWLYGVKQSQLTLSEYKRYVIQHEFMHALGYDHQPCNNTTAPNGVCPVLYQSTRGCPRGFKCGFDITNYDYDKKINGSYF